MDAIDQLIERNDILQSIDLISIFSEKGMLKELKEYRDRIIPLGLTIDQIDIGSQLIYERSNKAIALMEKCS